MYQHALSGESGLRLLDVKSSCFALASGLNHLRHVFSNFDFVARAFDCLIGKGWAQCVSVEDQVLDCLADLLNTVPGRVPSRSRCRNSFSSYAIRFSAVFADRSFPVLAMAYLFDAAGRYGRPGLTFALLWAVAEAPQARFSQRFGKLKS